MRKIKEEDVLGIAEELSPTKYSVKQHAGDDIIFEEEVFENSSRLQKLVEEQQEEYPPINHLITDVFHALYKYNPRLEHEHSMDLDYILNHQVIEHLMDSSRYVEFRQNTKLDMLSAQIATEIFCENIMDLVKLISEEQKEKKEKAKECEKQIKDLKDKADAMGLTDSEKYSLEQAKERLQELKNKMKDKFTKKRARKLDQKIQLSIDQNGGVQNCIQNWDLGHDGTFQKMGYREKIDLINKLKNSKKLNKISLLAGKLQDIYFEGKKKKSKKTKSSIRDITLGNDVSRTIAADLANLAMRGTKKLFYKRYAERKLRQHEYGGKSEKGKGAIVALLDSSGSMMGDNEIWSKAVALTLLDISRKQNRNFFCIHFDGDFNKENLHTNAFDKNNPYNIQEVVDMAEYFAGGGTDFETPLSLAKDKIDMEKNYSKADIVMVTDGQSAVSDDWLKDYLNWKTKNDITIFSVLIAKSGYGSKKTLGEFSDTIKQIDDIKGKGSSVAVDLFSHLNY